MREEASIYHEELVKRNQELNQQPFGVDDITWQDLEMDEVFDQMNHTRSYVGEQVLYHRLHDTDSAAKWQRLEQIISYLEEHPKNRCRIVKKLSFIGKIRESFCMPTFFMNSDIWRIPQEGFLHILQLIFVVTLITAILLGNAVAIVAFIASAITNLFVYILMKQKLLQGSIDLCQQVANHDALTDVDLEYYLDYVSNEEKEGRHFAEIDEFLQDFSDFTWQSNPFMGQMLFGMWAVWPLGARILNVAWLFLLIAMPIILTIDSILDEVHPISVVFWLTASAIMLVSFLKYRKGKKEE